MNTGKTPGVIDFTTIALVELKTKSSLWYQIKKMPSLLINKLKKQNCNIKMKAVQKECIKTK